MRKLIFTLFLMLAVLNANNLATNEALIPHLKANQNWESVKQLSEGAQLYHKNIPNLELAAIRISDTVALAPELLIQVFEDVPNYQQFLKSASAIVFDVINVSPATIIGYQYLQIPLLKNRHYLYKMVRASKDQPADTQSAHWTLIPPQNSYQDFLQQKISAYGEPVYLHQGAGLFKVTPLPNGKTKVSYSLFMDPGGNLPGFLIQMVNEQGIVNLLRDVIDEAEYRQQQQVQKSANQKG